MIKLWQDLSFKFKICILIFVMLGFAAVVGVGYHRLTGDIRDLGVSLTTDMMLSSYENELKDIVDVMAVSLAEAAAGETSQAGIYRTFTRLIRTARFFPDQSGYFFIYKKGGIVFSHAAQPELEGKNLIDFKDPGGKRLIRELENAARSGGGYVEYVWEKPGKGLKPKLSYARMIPGFDYWIGTGVYIDDIQDKKQEILNSAHGMTTQFLKKLQIFLVIILLGVIGPLSWLLVRGIVNPIQELTEVANRYSLGNLEMIFPTRHRKDEIGRLASAIERMGISIQLAMDRLSHRTSARPGGTNPLNRPGTASNSPLHSKSQSKSKPGMKPFLPEPDSFEKAQLTGVLFDHWQLHWKDQLRMLGLNGAGPEKLAQIIAGRHIPDSEDLKTRLDLFLEIYKALGIGMPGKKILSPAWIKNPNSFLDRKSPIDIIEHKGVEGLCQVVDIICKVAANAH